MIRNLIFFLFVSISFGSTFTIDTGTSRFGNTRYSQTSPVTVTTSGTPTFSPSAGYVYYDIAGSLKISVPPGVTGSCSGAPCNVFTSDSNGASHYLPGGHALATNYSDALYWIDPIFNTTTSRSGSYSLLANAPSPLTNAGGEGFAVGPFEVDLKFKSSSNGYIHGIRFYRMAQDTSTDQLVTLYTDTGTVVAGPIGFSGMTSSGWQTAYFVSPVAITANTFYRASFHSTVGTLYRNGFFRNYSIANNALSSSASYNGGNGSCDPTDGWPQTSDGWSSGGQLSSAGIIGCVTYNSDGTIGINSPGPGDFSGTTGFSPFGNKAEGCQCMIGGRGPGPYAVINTVISGSGNMWHYDHSGGPRRRENYYHYRGYMMWPPTLRTGTAGSDGFDHHSRQLMEWKGGAMIHIEGVTFQYAWNDSQASSLMLPIGNREYGTHDIWIGNNEFRHGPGVTNVGSQYEESPPVQRIYFGNNFIWDIGAYGSQANGFRGSGNGWLFQGGGPSEDFTIDHNTWLPSTGRVPSLFHLEDQDIREGPSITNNIFPIESQKKGISTEASCNNSGEAVIFSTCDGWRNIVFKDNYLYPSSWTINDSVTLGGPFDFSSTMTQTDVQNAFPTLQSTNYIPNITSFSQIGFFNLPSLKTSAGNWNYNVDAILKHTSSLVSGGTYKSTDGKNMGADMNALRIAQGAVTLTGTPNNLVTNSGATVVFIAPDSQSCPVDYKIYDATDPYITTGFSRANDTGTTRNRNVAITGLQSKATYAYRVDCAAQQPTGLFRTK